MISDLQSSCLERMCLHVQAHASHLGCSIATLVHVSFRAAHVPFHDMCDDRCMDWLCLIIIS